MRCDLSKTAFAVAVITLACVTARPQTITADEIVSRAADQVPVYLDKFRNLMSRETKTIESFAKNGELKRRRRVESTFLIYQSTRDEGLFAEYRNVVAVDGKPLEGADKRAADLFDRVRKAETSAAELRRLEDEGSRFDGDLSVTGMTFFQGVALFGHIRPSMEFRLKGTAAIDGSQTFVVDYLQTAPSPYVTTDPRRLPRDGKTPVIYDLDHDGLIDGRLRGTLWIDAATFQIRRELREFAVQTPGASAPVTAARDSFEYVASEFGILTPRKIVVTTFRIDAKKGASREDERITMEYERFTRPDVEVRSSDVRSP
ncbi:MAG: hypothetical protein ACK4S4_09840 [Pyrinomonadaceae bacterium]